MPKPFADFLISKLKTQKMDKNFQASISMYVYGSIGALLAAAIYFFTGLRLLSAFIAFAGLLFVCVILIFLRGYHKASVIVGLIGVSIVALAGDIILGIGCGGHYFLLVSGTLYFATDRNKSVLRYVAGLGCLLEFAAICVFLSGATPVVVLPTVVVSIIDKINLVIAFGAIGFTVHNFSKAVEENEEIHREYHSKLLDMANTDQLTGLPNRRCAYQRLELLEKKHHPAGTGFVVGLIDIDNFKCINDAYGHLCGDEVLVKAGAVIKSALRKLDFVGRWGGEEFFIILPNTSFDDGMEIIERMKKSFEETVFYCGNAQMTITLTIGVSAYPGFSSVTELIRQADEFLYKGKGNGKNCVVGFCC